MRRGLPPTVILLDIDGTLLHAGGAGRRALEAAMAEHLGGATRSRAPWLAGMKLDGMTDRLIVREAMLAVDHAFDDALCDRILDSYAGLLERELAGSDFRLLPGVVELLAALSARRARYGLCTGNTSRGARLKLARGGIDHLFGFEERDIHGFASDGEARELIVEAAPRRASALLGRPLDPRAALVVGDTPRDVTAARAAGCRSLAVATGRFGVEALRAEGADHVVPTLELAHVGPLLLAGPGDREP